MTEPKTVSKEAMAVFDAIDFSYSFALALDAWGEALLKRQAETNASVRDACEPEQCHEYQSELIEERDKLQAKLEATNREIDALTEQDLKYHMKAKVYGELAYKWRKRCLDAGLASEEDHILADEWHEREKELEATRKELALEVKGRGEYREQIDVLVGERDKARKQYYVTALELESLCKPLEGELAEDVATVRKLLGSPGATWEAVRAGIDAIDRIGSALRAKGAGKDAFISWFSELEPGEQIDIWYAVDACTHGEAVGVLRSKVDALTSELAALRAKGEPQAAEPHYTNENEIDAVERYDERRRVAAQAAEPPEPRPIVVGSNWAHVSGTPKGALGVRTVEAVDVHGLGHIKLEGITGTWSDNFRNEWEWLNDPEPAAPAPELPRKVEPGTELVPGARYRITEVASWDEDPGHRTGEELVCWHGPNAGTILPGWGTTVDGRCWRAHALGRDTYVTGLELVADAPKGESK